MLELLHPNKRETPLIWYVCREQQALSEGSMIQRGSFDRLQLLVVVSSPAQMRGVALVALA